jgi:23S rRNA (guanosine2251-2'-O)-methyltransferase
MIDEATYIYGKHAVAEAVGARPDIVRAVHCAEGIDGGLLKQIKRAHIPLVDLNPKKLPKGVPSDSVHQGIIAEINPRKMTVAYEDFIAEYPVTNDSAFVLLGEVQDPHNVGAVIRSAVAFGLAGVLIPEHRQAQVNGTVIKVSAGMAFRIPLIQIGNVNTTIKDLKERGFWIYGLAGDAEQTVEREDFEKPSVIILGNEGDGIRTKTLEHCDIPLRIPMHKNAESLNASVAAGVVLHAWSVKHPGVLR